MHLTMSDKIMLIGLFKLVIQLNLVKIDIFINC